MIKAPEDSHGCCDFPLLFLPVLVALYMFSMGKAEPSPYSKTLERAGISWVVVTSTFTQFGLQQHTTAVLLLLITHTSHSPCDQPGVDERQGFKRLRQPQVGENLHLPPQL